MDRIRAFVDRPALARAQGAVATEEHGGALLVGGPRVGKTALLERLVPDLSSPAGMSNAQHSLVRVRPTRGTSGMAGGAFLPLLDAEAQVLSDAQLMRELLRLLVPGGARQPWLVADDMHLLDDVSLGLLSQLLGDARLRVLATVRTDAHADLTGRCPEVALAELVEVNAFSEQELAELARTRLGASLDPWTTMRLAQFVAGDPGLFIDVIETGVREGRLRDRWGVRVWDGELAVPAQSRAALHQPLSQLGRSARQALDLLALVQPMELDLLQTLLDVDTVEELEGCGFVRVDRTGTRYSVQLRTPAFGPVLHHNLAASRARRLARAASGVIQGFGRRRPQDDLRLACLAAAAGDPVGEPLLERALEQALVVGNLSSAERLVRSWPVHRPVPRPLQARLLLLREDLAGAEQLLAALDDEPSPAPETTALRARNLVWGLGDPAAGRAVAGRSHSAQDAALAGIDLLARALQGHAVQVVEDASAVHRAAQHLDDHARLAMATSLLDIGLVTNVLELTPPSRTAAPDLRAVLHGTLGRASLLLGDVTLAKRVLDTLTSEQRTAAVVVSECELLRGCLDLHHGRPARAAVHLQTALALSHDGDWPLRRVRALALLAVCHAWTGATVPAREVLAEAATAAAGWPELTLATAVVELARAETLLATGALRSAYDLASELAVAAEDAGRRTDAVLALHLAARAQPTTQVAHALRRLADRCTFVLARLHADHASALVEHDGRGLMTVADGYRTAGAVPLAAEAALQAAAVFHERGRAALAATATVQGEALVGTLDFPAPPWWPAPGGTVLTPREWEVAALAAQGMGSKAIADRLHLSTRTVDNHLQHCFRKLAISNRSELGMVLHAPRRPGTPFGRPPQTT